MGYLQDLKATLDAKTRDEEIVKGVLEHLVVVMRSAFVSRQADERWWRKDDVGAFRAARHFDDAVTFDPAGKACVALDFRIDDVEREGRAVRIGVERKGDGFRVSVEMKDPIQVPVNPMPEDCNKFAALVFEAAKARL
jgi:hypothetical protein